MSTIDLTNLDLLDIYGISRRPLEGSVTQNELAYLMIDEWIPYFECHKCGRYDYCKFPPTPRPANPYRSKDIQCGATVSIIKNYVKSCFPVLMKYDNEQKQQFLDASFYFCDFINFTEISLGAYLSNDISNRFVDRPTFFTGIIDLRHQLDQIAAHLSSIPEFDTTKGFLLVEGESEKEFVITLKESNDFWFKDVLVESYGGKSNRKPAKLVLLSKTFKRSGHELYIQGDKDSMGSDIFLQLVKQKIVKSENTLAFAHDFESSIPDYLLLEALNRLDYLNGISIEEFTASRQGFKNSVIECLETRWSINIDSIKIPLAKEIAKLYLESTLSTDEDFCNTELGEFINLIKMMS